MRVNMGGSGSASDTQTYDAKELITAAKAHAKHYQTLRDQFHRLRAAFQQIAGLGSDFQGHGAQAIKQFYTAQVNVTDSWLRLIDKKIAYFQDVAGTIDDKNLGGDTQVRVPFLNEDLSWVTRVPRKWCASGMTLPRFSAVFPILSPSMCFPTMTSIRSLMPQIKNVRKWFLMFKI
ncbi:LXG domain-containing protein [Sporolactobacillus shoreicorticis]|uniref:T7SS effector LXG polymorphic toxin n=1 Tax=Sporolactobacillus shoreicorticis TaxID=1923877 RepID=A0ABW5S3W6_9BACL|nr:T7SS effector LXG polymorphic toxin [Sporolactobacillus shoreicorticis]MCO7125895.1 LXG domain-containing protein [Sporolactobacillus shoreicorticis]